MSVEIVFHEDQQDIRQTRVGTVMSWEPMPIDTTREVDCQITN